MHPSMFIAALFTVAKIQKKPKCPSTDDSIKKLRCTHTHTHTHTQWDITQSQKRMTLYHLQQHGWIWSILYEAN